MSTRARPTAAASAPVANAGSIAISPDGTSVYVGSPDGSVVALRRPPNGALSGIGCFSKLSPAPAGCVTGSRAPARRPTSRRVPTGSRVYRHRRRQPRDRARSRGGRRHTDPAGLHRNDGRRHVHRAWRPVDDRQRCREPGRRVGLRRQHAGRRRRVSPGAQRPADRERLHSGRPAAPASHGATRDRATSGAVASARDGQRGGSRRGPRRRLSSSRATPAGVGQSGRAGHRGPERRPAPVTSPSSPRHQRSGPTPPRCRICRGPSPDATGELRRRPASARRPTTSARHPVSRAGWARWPRGRRHR